MRLVYLSPIPWSSFAQRPQKFVEWFHLRTGGEVLWVDPYPTRLPQLNDLKRPSSFQSGEAQQHYSWLTLTRPRALPVEPLPTIAQLNRLLWKKLFDELQDFCRNRETVIVIGKPSHLALCVLERLPKTPSVYDAMDEFPAFYKGLSKVSMANCEKRLVSRVDQLWVTSTRLKERWITEKPDLLSVPNGLDPSTFSDAERQVPRESGSKVFGYVGTIASWFDWNWVVQLANARSSDYIRLIGPVFTPPQILLPKNVQLCPPCKHEEAMKTLLTFDVGIIPFKQNELTASVDPIKYYEYRASGLPVLSTDFGEMKFRRHEPGTFICHTEQDLNALARLALTYVEPHSQRQEFAFENSWNRRFDCTELLTQSDS